MSNLDIFTTNYSCGWPQKFISDVLGPSNAVNYINNKLKSVLYKLIIKVLLKFQDFFNKYLIESFFIYVKMS